MSSSKVVLVTGVSSGLGRAIAATLAEKGFKVFGTARSVHQQLPAGVELIQMDLRDDTSVRTAALQVVARAGRIDTVVSCAGATLIGAIEETELSQVRELFELNFFGAARLAHAVLPHMRAQRAGRIVFVSSVVGFIPAPYMGFYAASKHALEGYVESLDHETRTLGIRTVLVEPGYMRTNADKNAMHAKATLPDYASARARVSARINAQIQAGDDPEAIAKVVVRAITDRAPSLRYRAGKGIPLLAWLRSVLPASMFDRSLRKETHLDA